MMRRFRFGGTPILVSVAIMALLVAVMASPIAADVPAGSLGELLSKNCPAAVSLDKERHRAWELADESQYQLAKRDAELFYDCYHQVSDPYARDWAHFYYLLLLSNSAKHWSAECNNAPDPP